MEKENKLSRGSGMIIVIVIIIVIIIAFYYIGNNSNNQPQINQNLVETPTQPSMDPTQLIALKSKCAEDGAKYIDNFERSLPKAGLWNAPSYHFNQRLNTCLASINWLKTINTSTAGDITSSNFSITSTGVFYAYVFDVYSNQVVLQHEADITTLNKGGALTTLSENLTSPPLFSAPNLDTDSFKKQYQILFSE